MDEAESFLLGRLAEHTGNDPGVQRYLKEFQNGPTLETLTGEDVLGQIRRERTGRARQRMGEILAQDPALREELEEIQAEPDVTLRRIRTARWLYLTFSDDPGMRRIFSTALRREEALGLAPKATGVLARERVGMN